MLILQAFFMFGALIFTVWSSDSTDHGEYGNDNEFRKSICESESEGLHSDMEICFKLETKAVREGMLECLKKASPDTEDNITAYVKAACENKEIFHTLDACYEGMKNQAASKKKMEVTKEAGECYMEAAKKHGLDLVITYFDEVSK
nr:uncharacterized protein LOC107445207 [Parasteatoda tepidariorum]